MTVHVAVVRARSPVNDECFLRLDASEAARALHVALWFVGREESVSAVVAFVLIDLQAVVVV